jgi:hypothetical protein
MSLLRRRLASCALVVIALQMTGVFAAPLSACCPTRTAAAVAAADKDCCPAGSHAPGQCPLHKRSTSASRVSCRLQCDAPHGLQFVAGAIGVLPAPATTAVPFAVEPIRGTVRVLPELPDFVPDSPPPRS